MITAKDALMLERWDGSALVLNGRTTVEGGRLGPWTRSDMGPFESREAPVRITGGDGEGNEGRLVLYRHLDISTFSCSLAVGPGERPDRLVDVLSAERAG